LKLLLVRLREIGDVVFTTATLAALRERFPDAAITYLVEPVAAPVVAGNPLIDELLVIPRVRGIGGIVSDLKLGRRLQRQRFDIAIDFHGGPRASLLTWLSGAPDRIGYDVAGRGWMYTRQIPRSRVLQARHSVVNQWDLLEPLGVAAPDRSRFPVSMPIDDSVGAAVVGRLAGAGAIHGAPLIVIHVSAGNPFRRWPLASFAEVIAHLASRPDQTNVIVTSGPSERAAAAAVMDQARGRMAEHDRRRVLDCGEFSLVELRALVDRAALFIGGDSGPMHIAATSQVPILSLYGPTLPARSQPWRDPHLVAVAVETNGLPCRPCNQRVCEPGDFRCLTRITAQDVIARASEILGGLRIVG
jgi:ADP-heptose:LPS heptosyltransferase